MLQRLWFINRYYWPDESATAQLLTDLAEALAQSSREVAVVTGRQLLDVPAGNLAIRERHNGVAIHRLWTTRFGRKSLLGRACDYLSFYLSAALFVLKNVRRGDTVIAKTDPPLLGAVLAPFAGLKQARLINWWQDVYPDVAMRLGVLRDHGLLAGFFTTLRNISLRRAAHNVVVGERMRAHLYACESRSAPFTTIHNWSADLRASSTPALDNPYRRDLGLAGKVVFAYSGNLGRAHRFDTLLAVGRELQGRKDIQFLIIGGGAQFESVRNSATLAGLGNWSFLPYQPRAQLSESLGAADVHLVSLDPQLEGLIVPSKIYGVLSAGRPTLFIGDRDGEVARLLARHDCGHAIPLDSPAGLERAILELASDPELRRRLGANARSAYERAYAFPFAVRQWEGLL